jgi:alkyl sulfatase BDS1-like metallo-beta-lactamase superfamily hydrolase
MDSLNSKFIYTKYQLTPTKDSILQQLNYEHLDEYFSIILNEMKVYGEELDKFHQRQEQSNQFFLDVVQSAIQNAKTQKEKDDV